MNPLRVGSRWTAWAIACVLVIQTGLFAQDKTPADKKTAPPPPPPPQDFTVTTKDNLELCGTFFPGTKGKESVPVILLHASKGSRSDYKDLARFLQAQGHAVTVPDLRGHGASTRFKGSNKPLEQATMPPDQYAKMVEYDMESIKSFLLGKNNAGELNIEKLCVVGAEMGAVVALDWARLDWSWPTLAVGKQGQDVKAVVMISPEWSFKSLNLSAALGNPDVRSRLSILILAGKQKSDSDKAAKRVHSAFKRYHTEPSKKEDRDLFLGSLDTSLQGTKMLGVKSLNVEGLINEFINLRLVKQPFPWRARGTSP